MNPLGTLSLVIPLYNEADNIPSLVHTLTSCFTHAHIPYQLILVNNGSSDATPELIATFAQKNSCITPVTIPVNQGYGHGIITGLHAARGDYVGYTDGDNQIPSAVIAEAYTKLFHEHFDLVKGRRSHREDGLLRTICSQSYDILFRIMFGVPYSQVNSKPKLMKRKVYEQMHLTSKDWFIDSEIMIHAHKLGCSVAEVNYTFKKRFRGASAVKPRIIIEFLKNLYKYKIRE